MAHRALIKAAKDTPVKLQKLFAKGNQKPHQDFRNLLVLDFEATCDKRNGGFVCQEIIEFPCVVLSTEDWKVKDVFHEYVKPKINPNISSFCTELTGIIQDVVEDQPYFPEIFDKFNTWLKDGSYLKEENKSAFITSGDWDFKVMLPNQCKLSDIHLPSHFQEWIDLKKTFSDSTNHYPRGLKHMANLLNLPFTGKLHSGINDVNNMVRFIIKLYELHKINFVINSSLNKPNKMLFPQIAQMDT